MTTSPDAIRGGAPGEAETHVRLGELLVAEGLVTPSQLEEALRVQRTPDRYAPLGHILITQKVITRDQLLSVLERHRRSSKLGDILVKSREISRSQLDAALEEQRRTQQTLSSVLLRLGYISEERLRVALCRTLHIRFFNLDAIVLDSTLRSLVSEAFATKHRLVPVSRIGDLLILAMDDPTQTRLVAELQHSTGLKIEVITSTSAHITRALERLYRVDPTPGVMVAATGAEAAARPDEPAPDREADGPDDVVRTLLRLAVDRGASDVHLETVSHGLRARFRIDGVLHHLDLGALGHDVTRQRVEVLSSLKILAGLDAAERKRPQDGRFRARIAGDGRPAVIDFRVSLIPSFYGENAVIRILDPRGAPESVAALDLSAAVTERLLQVIRTGEGMVLVAGPPGSGKSTTLFAIMKSVYRPEIKIVSAEDPIVYVCPEVCQHEVDERNGSTFAAYARSFLHHDPEVIMLGELRDSETARLAFRAAQTGHLVLSAVHALDTAGAVGRVKDLGVDSAVCAASLRAVLAQRLVREICGECKEEYTPAAGALASMFESAPRDLRWYRGIGCAACQQTGYRGRLALAELWTPGGDDVLLINQNAPLDAIGAAARKNTHSMASDALAKLREGRTTVDELRRVLPVSALRELRAVAG